MTTNPRSFTVRYVPGTFTQDAALYGSGEYGDDKTYGQEGVEPAAGLSYVLRPAPGWWPVEPAWEFRQWDAGVAWEAVATSEFGNLPLSQLEAAVMILDPIGLTSVRPSSDTFPLDLTDQEAVLYGTGTYGDDKTYGQETREGQFGDVMRYVFIGSDLDTPGMFRVTVKMLFRTGKQMTIEADDRATMYVAEAALGE